MSDTPTHVAVRPASSHGTGHPDFSISPEISPSNAPTPLSMLDILTDLSIHTTSSDDVQHRILSHVAAQTQMMTRFEVHFAFLDQIMVILQQQTQILSANNDTVAEDPTNIAQLLINQAQIAICHAVLSSCDEGSRD
ncbi:hypothetical protein U1Q18_007658 [Sarracenia purpurea var. burkii]